MFSATLPVRGTEIRHRHHRNIDATQTTTLREWQHPQQATKFTQFYTDPEKQSDSNRS